MASAGSSQAINYETSVYSNKISVANSTEITFVDAGTYNVQFSLQFLNFTPALDDVVVWFRKNGTDIPLSSSVQQVPTEHGSNPGATILALNSLVDVLAGENVELYWTSINGNTVLGTSPSGVTPVYPTAPAVIVTATQVA